MIKAHEVSRKYIMLFMHNNFNWFTYFIVMNYTACTHSPPRIFWNISEIFHEIFPEIFHAKNFMKFYITSQAKPIRLLCVDVSWGYRTMNHIEAGTISLA